MQIKRPALAFALVMTAFCAGNAVAQEADAVALRLKETLAAQSVELNWSTVSGDNRRVVIEGATYGVSGVPDVVKIGQIILDDVKDDNGGYLVATMSFPSVTLKQQGVDFEMSDAEMRGVRIPAAGTTGYLANRVYYDTGRIQHIRYSFQDKEIAVIDNVSSTMTPPTAVPMRYTATVERFNLDPDLVADPKNRAMLQALGYDKITGNIDMEGSWNLSDGRVDMSKFDININDVGKFGITLDLGGYTPEFLNVFQELAKKVNEAPRSDEAREAAMPMLAMLSSLVLNGASVRFDDASVTNKVLDFTARQQGADPSQLREQTKTILPFLLASSPIKDEALKNEIAAAVSAYLDDPRSLAIYARPASPQPLATITGLMQVDPAALATTLGLSIRANE